MTRKRLDIELVRRGLASSRTAAQEQIAAGRVLVAKMVATKPATQVDTAAPIEVTQPAGGDEYVSRGAHKLLGALEAFQGKFPPIKGAKCLDAGASTGGFTDVLLRRGASEVLCVDVGYGQLAWSVQSDPRVRILDRTNVRYLEPEQVGPSPEIVVADLSFISLTLVLPALVRCCPDATMMLMVKPQFEAGKGRIGSSGVVRDPKIRAEAVRSVAEKAIDLGLEVVAIAPSPLPGPSGNVEYFLLLKPSAEAQEDQGLSEDELETAIWRAVSEGPDGDQGSNQTKGRK